MSIIRFFMDRIMARLRDHLQGAAGELLVHELGVSQGSEGVFIARYDQRRYVDGG